MYCLTLLIGKIGVCSIAVVAFTISGHLPELCCDSDFVAPAVWSESSQHGTYLKANNNTSLSQVDRDKQRLITEINQCR
jgi:hypothetical protein